MSAEESILSQLDMAMIADLFGEASYISEVARKLRSLNLPMGYTVEELSEVETIASTWGSITHLNAVQRVMLAVYILTDEENERFDVFRQGYDVDEISSRGGSQRVGSVHLTFSEDGFIDQKEWKDYAIIHNTKASDLGSELDRAGWHPIGSRIRDNVDLDIGIDEKIDIVKRLSRKGNDVSKDAELILQDVLKRQFRYYEEVGFSDYNDPGPDFWVRDNDRRDYGIVCEISVRHVNPIGTPYISSKINQLLDMEESDDFGDQPFDLVIMAPRFTKDALREYEDPDDPDFHSDPLSQMVHLHRVPMEDVSFYRPYLYLDNQENGGDSGNPVIVPDNKSVRDRIGSLGHVGEGYPVVSDDMLEFINDLEGVFRDFQVIPESYYRNMIRESVEPLLWEFMRPYKIEQFLIDTYWDKGLTQSEIGRLVDRSGSTIGDWMARDKWDIITRGTGAPALSDEVEEIWRRMYLGLDPFPREYSGYRIQAEYNRHPQWNLNDWDEWFTLTTEDERLELMSIQDEHRSNIDYMILTGVTDRIQPSYTFILRTLKDMGVEVRDPDSAPRVPYNAYSDRKTIEWMINKSTGTFVEDTEGSQRLGQEDVEVFDSYLEVDIATWLSENEIAYAHEPFTIPSDIGPGREVWNRMENAIRALGRREEEEFNRLKSGTPFADLTAFDAVTMWEDIYDKHRLANEAPVPPVRDSLEFFQKKYVLPDLVIYKGHGSNTEPIDWDGWGNWSHILEVSGLWGVGIPPDSDEEWWNWYRVAGVAFKEYIYKLLGLWDDVYFLVPNQPFIEGIADGIPNALRDDPHYIIFNTTSSELQLGGLYDALGLSEDDVSSIDTSLSPEIDLVEYRRPLEEGEIVPVRWTFDSVNMDNVDNEPLAVVLDEESIVYHGDLGEVYVIENGVYVKESQWRGQNMILLREYVLDSLANLEEEGIIEGLREQ